MIVPPLPGEDAIIAAIDLAGRTGACEFTMGYLHDDVPVAEAAWWASAQYRGARITVDSQPSPRAAAEGLAQRLLRGAQCNHCHRLVTLNPEGAWARDATLLDGTAWSAGQQAAAGVCLWRRDGRVWRRGCEVPTCSPTPKRRRRHHG